MNATQSVWHKEYYYSLDLLRFLAACLVTGFHLGFSSWINPHSNAGRLVAGEYRIVDAVDFVWFGWVGVQIFFVISGFVIANSADGTTPVKFLRGRIERLYPAAWICATLTALVWSVSGVVDWQEIVRRYLGSIALWPWGPWIDGQYWTLGCEIAFYAAVFALLACRQFVRLEWLASALTAMGSIFILVLAVHRLGWVEVPYLTLFTKGALRPLPFYYGQFFGLGMLIWLSVQGRLTRTGMTCAVIALCTGSLQIGIGAFSAVHLEERAYLGLQQRWMLPVLAWLVACLVIWLSRPLAQLTSGWNSATLRGIRVLGLMTYPQYLVHFTLGVWMIRNLVERGAAPLSALLCAIVVILFVSYLVAVYGEKWVRKQLRSILALCISDAAIERRQSLRWLGQAAPRLANLESASSS